MLTIERTNTILYSASWPECVAFYRDALRLPISFENAWFVEFELVGSSFLSVADAARSTIPPGHGDGITLSWEVADATATGAALAAAGVVVSPPGTRFGATVIDVFDPDHNRIEFWSRQAA